MYNKYDNTALRGRGGTNNGVTSSRVQLEKFIHLVSMYDIYFCVTEFLRKLKKLKSTIILPRFLNASLYFIGSVWFSCLGNEHVIYIFLNYTIFCSCFIARFTR